jgi:phosphate-selective porin OprO and OprP
MQPAPATTAAPPAPTSATPTAAASVLPEPPPPVAAPPDSFGPNDPLAGFTGDTAFLRSADNEFQLMPSGRLQVDGLFYKRETDKMPTPTILLRRARLELGGWIGSWFFFNIGGDFAAGAPAGANPIPQSWIATTDDYVGIAPWGNVALLQVGQFDAPFTLENRTSDKYFDFMERSITVRAFGVPSNKESGAMVHGIAPNKGFYYSIGVFNGDGQNFKNADSKFDIIGRAWVAPLALAGEKSLEDIEVGGSLWLGTRAAGTGLPLAKQTTQGQLVFLDNAWALPAAMMGGADTPVELHQDGDLKAFAIEANVPIQHKYGARFEYVH